MARGASRTRTTRRTQTRTRTPPREETAFLFDLDGTLVDSVYQHVLSWQEALEAEGIELAVWRVHRRIGMSGGLFTNMLLRETGLALDRKRVARLLRRHAQAYRHYARHVRPLPGARALLDALTEAGIPWAIATSGRRESAGPVLETLGLDLRTAPVVTREMVRHAKPDPDLFLAAAAGLGVRIEKATVVGDSVWDMLAARRARALGIGLLSGGYGTEELERAGAYRVYEDPADLLRHLDEVGGRR
jgi:HAD superfamily hydrolase (TIGR01509 family)